MMYFNIFILHNKQWVTYIIHPFQNNQAIWKYWYAIKVWRSTILIAYGRGYILFIEMWMIGTLVKNFPQDIVRLCIPVDKSLTNYANRISTYQKGDNFVKLRRNTSIYTHDIWKTHVIIRNKYYKFPRRWKEVNN